MWIELATIAEAIERDAKWEFFINLSGMDYPIKTHKEITQFLGQNRGKSFIEHTYPTPKLLEAVHNYYIECSVGPVQVKGAEGFVAQFPSGTHVNATIPYARGEHWWVLSREFCEWLVSSSTVRKMLQWGKHILLPDEYFIMTAAVWSPHYPFVVSDHLRYIRRRDNGKRDLEPMDVPLMKNSTALFARKFNPNANDVLSVMEAWLKEKIEKETAQPSHKRPTR